MKTVTPRLAILGGGRMGEALAVGLTSSAWGQPGEIVVVEPVAARRNELSALHADLRVVAALEGADGVVLAVKPQDVADACRAVAATDCRRVLSIAAGVRLDALAGWLGDQVAVVRSMPNTPAVVGAAASAITGGPTASDADLDWAESILAAVGKVVRVSEPLLDSVTGLSGSGPAYVFLVAEALIEAGVLSGLARPVSRELAVQTLLGSARMLAELGEDPEDLRAAVTSPGGTTAAGLRVLESRAVRSAFLEAVTAAVERSRELGRS